MKSLILVLFSFLSISVFPNLSSPYYFAGSTCQIVISTSSGISFYSEEGGLRVKVDTANNAAHIFSSNQHFLAVEEPTEDASAVVEIYHLSNSNAEKVVSIPDMRLIRGSAWSNDETKLLLQDAFSNALLYIYDVSSEKVVTLYKSFDPGLEVFQVVWSPDDQNIAFVAREAPFPTTDYGINKVDALYIMSMNHNNGYRPISKSDENVDWYFGNVIWLSDSSVAFTSCNLNGKGCGLKEASNQGAENLLAEGKFMLLDWRPESMHLVLFDHSAISISVDKVQLTEPVPQLKIDAVFDASSGDLPVPIFVWSPDGNKIAYLNDHTQEAKITDISNSLSDVLSKADSTFQLGAWSMDSQRILFYSQGDIYIHDLYHQTSQKAFPVPLDETPTHSPEWVCLDETL